MNLTPALFRQAISKRIDGLKRLCTQWGIPSLGTKVTIIMRDPANDDMSLVQTDEEDLEEVIRVVRRLVQKGR
jgi:hypothetical protein